MFDQIEAESELDFIIGLRSTLGDEQAIATMRNHWSGFISDADLDVAYSLGVNAVRVPVGYWITEAPVGGGSPYEYGFSHEGFVTGGLNHLHAMLRKLKARGIVAVLDMHSLPCAQACVSNGMACAAPYAFSPNRTLVGTGGVPRCEGGVYPTSRDPSASYYDVAIESVVNLARWVAELPEEDAAVIAALQLANEPALNTKGCMAAIKDFYRAVLSATRAVLPTLPLVLNFIYPNAMEIDTFMAEVQGWGSALLLDVHWYLNWAGDFKVNESDKSARNWTQIHDRACHSSVVNWNWCAAANVSVMLGEWSLATNHDAPLDLSDAVTAAELRAMFAEQLSVYSFARDAPLVGHFFWTLRMGSGWDPRPSAAHPHGAQMGDSASSRSLDGFPFQVWSLLELARHGIATRLDAPDGSACDGVVVNAVARPGVARPERTGTRLRVI